MGILVTIAVVAILAGVLGPMLYRQAIEARIADTRQEMEQLDGALNRFFIDTGRFPSEAEGLAALVADPGVSGWQGPYLSGERWAAADELTRDGFGEDYVYDHTPTTNPVIAADILLVSGGSDNTISTGVLNDTWATNSTDNDILVFIEADLINRDKVHQARQELQNISDGAKAYFEDHAAFPTQLSDLQDSYQDGSFSGSSFVDPWLRPYELVVDNTAVPPTLVFTSRGPDGVDDNGTGDDVSLAVDSVVPGRKKTFYLIRIAQSMVDEKSGVSLTGDWDNDYSDFSLLEPLQFDGWGKLFEEAQSTRTILSAGPDGDYYTPEDNIPYGVIPDDEGEGPALEYVEGSASVSGGSCNYFSLDITNTSDESVSVSTVKLSWPTPTAFYKEIEWNGTRVARAFILNYWTGKDITLYSPQTLAPGEVATLRFERFTKYIFSGAKPVSMSGAYISLFFSDGSLVEVTLPGC